MTPRSHEGHHGELGSGIGQPRSREMTVDVVHREERQTPAPCDRLGRLDAYQQRAYETRTHGHGHSTQVVERASALAEGLRHHRRHPLHMGAAGDLGDHAAIPFVDRVLRVGHRREHPSFRTEDRGGRIVTRRLDGKERTGQAARPILPLPGRPQRPHHHKGVFVGVRVVLGSDADDGESPRPVQRHGLCVSGPHLEDDLHSTLVRRP